MSVAQKLYQIEHNKALLERMRRPQFSVENFCFKQQIDFIKDPSRFKTAVCSRRAGKTTACAAHLIHEALANPNRVCFYITLSRANAKRLIWKEVLEINRQYYLGGKANETDLSLSFPNGSVIYFSGANDRSEIDKFRGFAITPCYLDECQSFPSYIEDLIEEVISKALFDYNGSLCLIGTPGRVPVGYFYEKSHSTEWSHHKWNMFDNPWLQRKSGKTPQQILEEELLRKGVSDDDPTIQRECFGQWRTDNSALVFRYEPNLNDFRALPSAVGHWNFILGVDVGFNDADAIAVIGFNDRLKETYLIEEVVKRKQGITELADTIDLLIKKYDPMKVVMDTGGLGKKIAEELTKRRSLPIEAADKTRKFENIELLNDAMRTKRFFAKRNSRFAIESALVEIDKDKSTPDRIVISDRFHSDITDAVLYAFRESYHWTYQEPVKLPRLHTPEWFEMEAKRMEETLENQIQEQNYMKRAWGDE